MFGAYRIGAGTPANLYVPPMPYCVKEVMGKGASVYAMGCDASEFVSDTMGVSNFFAGQKQGTVLGYYKQGADIGASPWIATPAFMRDEMLRVLDEATSLGKDINDANKQACSLPGDRRSFSKTGNSDCARLNRFIDNTWSPFLHGLDAFVNEHRPWTARLWGSLYTEIQEYRKRVIAMRGEAITLGVGVTAPVPTLPPEPAISQIGKTLKTILYFVVGGLIVWLLFNTVVPMLRGAAVA